MTYSLTLFELATDACIVDRFLLKVLRCSGYQHAINLSRINPFCQDLAFKSSALANAKETLLVGDKPALCFSLVFVNDSNISAPRTLHFGELAKDAFVLPIMYEFERMVGALAYIADTDTVTLRCWGEGIRMATRNRPLNWPGWNPASSSQDGKGKLLILMYLLDNLPLAKGQSPAKTSPAKQRSSRFGKVAGENYQSPARPPNPSKGVVKEPTQNSMTHFLIVILSTSLNMIHSPPIRPP